MRTLYLARHGQSEANAVRRFQGIQDVPLSDLGRRQAAALSAGLRGRTLAHVYASPLSRARHTAEVVASEHGRPLTVVDDLRELSLGDWEGLTVDEIRALPGDPYACWVRDPVAGCPPNGEHLERVQERTVRAIDAIADAHAGEDVLVVCHGGVISAYVAHCLGLPLSSIWRVTVANCSLTTIAPPRRVLAMNDTWHLAGVEPEPVLRSLSP